MSFLGSSAKQVIEDVKNAPKLSNVLKVDTRYSSAKPVDIKALGASDYNGIGQMLDVYQKGGLEYALNDIAGKNVTGSVSAKGLSSIGSSGSYGSGISYSGTGSAQQANVNQGKSLEQIINETVDKNNAWAAEQAQKQMDFQKMMSDTAHQREVEDLKKAGLNPVLSVTGGNGAAMASGAMAQPDTSNTRLLAEMSLASTEALGNSAVQLATGIRNKASNQFASKLLNVAEKYVIPTLAKGAASALSKRLFV